MFYGSPIPSDFNEVLRKNFYNSYRQSFLNRNKDDRHLRNSSMWTINFSKSFRCRPASIFVNVLKWISLNPGFTPSQIKEILNLANDNLIFQGYRWSGLVTSEKGHYKITNIGLKYLDYFK